MEASEIFSYIKAEFLAKSEPGGYALNHPSLALKSFFQLFARQKIAPEFTRDFYHFVQKESPGIRWELRRRLHTFFAEMLKMDFYHDSEQTRAMMPTEVSANTFSGFWLVLGALKEEENVMPSDPDLKNKFFYLVKLAQPQGLDLRFQDLSKANLSYLQVSQVDFSFANLNRVQMIHSVFADSNFYQADLKDAILNNSDISRSFMSFSNLAGARLIESNLDEVVLHGANLEKADLSQASLLRSNLDLANLNQADLSYASLQSGHFYHTDFRQSNLTRANLNHSVLDEVSFHDAILFEASFQQSEISNPDFNVNTALKANFSQAVMSESFKIYLKTLGAITE